MEKNGSGKGCDLWRGLAVCCGCRGVTVGDLLRVALCKVTKAERSEGKTGNGKRRVICPLWRVGAMPNIGKGRKVAFMGFFEGVRGQHGNGDGVRVVHWVLYWCNYYTKREFCIIPRDAVRSDGARMGAAGCTGGYFWARVREGVLPPLSVRKIFLCLTSVKQRCIM